MMNAERHRPEEQGQRQGLEHPQDHDDLGTNSAMKFIMNAVTVPRGMPVDHSDSPTGTTPAPLTLRGTPANAATGKNGGVVRLAHRATKSLGTRSWIEAPSATPTSTHAHTSREIPLASSMAAPRQSRWDRDRQCRKTQLRRRS